MKRLFGLSAALISAVSTLIGAAALWWYVAEVVIGQAGEPDRSMLFWGLPIVFLGLTALMIAGLLAWFAISQLRQTGVEE